MLKACLQRVAIPMECCLFSSLRKRLHVQQRPSVCPSWRASTAAGGPAVRTSARHGQGNISGQSWADGPWKSQQRSNACRVDEYLMQVLGGLRGTPGSMLCLWKYRINIRPFAWITIPSCWSRAFRPWIATWAPSKTLWLIALE